MPAPAPTDGPNRTQYKNTRCWIDENDRVWLRSSSTGWIWIGELWCFKEPKLEMTSSKVILAVRYDITDSMTGCRFQNKTAALTWLHESHNKDKGNVQ